MIGTATCQVAGLCNIVATGDKEKAENGNAKEQREEGKPGTGRRNEVRHLIQSTAC